MIEHNPLDLCVTGATFYYNLITITSTSTAIQQLHIFDVLAIHSQRIPQIWVTTNQFITN